MLDVRHPLISHDVHLVLVLVLVFLSQSQSHSNSISISSCCHTEKKGNSPSCAFYFSCHRHHKHHKHHYQKTRSRYDHSTFHTQLSLVLAPPASAPAPVLFLTPKSGLLKLLLLECKTRCCCCGCGSSACGSCGCWPPTTAGLVNLLASG